MLPVRIKVFKFLKKDVDSTHSQPQWQRKHRGEKALDYFGRYSRVNEFNNELIARVSVKVAQTQQKFDKFFENAASYMTFLRGTSVAMVHFSINVGDSPC